MERLKSPLRTLFVTHIYYQLVLKMSIYLIQNIDKSYTAMYNLHMNCLKIEQNAAALWK